MATNEELVMQIQQGDRSKLLELWEQNLGLVYTRAKPVLRALRRSKNIQRLHAHLEDRTDYYYHVGARSGRSPVEELVIHRETLAERWDDWHTDKERCEMEEN